MLRWSYSAQLGCSRFPTVGAKPSAPLVRNEEVGSSIPGSTSPKSLDDIGAFGDLLVAVHCACSANSSVRRVQYQRSTAKAFRARGDRVASRVGAEFPSLACVTSLAVLVLQGSPWRMDKSGCEPWTEPDQSFSCSCLSAAIKTKAKWS